MKNHTRYIDIIAQFEGKKILVLGDLILDVYLKGTSTRLCPEAPVPVVDVGERKTQLGGAANTVCNLQTLGAIVTFCTVIGNDPYGDEAIKLLKNTGCDCSLIIRHSERETIVKTRVVAGSQLGIRFDTGTQTEIDAATADQLNTFVNQCFEKFDAIIISDYDKGIVTPSVITNLKYQQVSGSRFLAIDSRRLEAFSNLKPSFVKPNYDETVKLMKSKPMYAERTQQVASFANTLFDATGAKLIAATLDKDGALLFENGNLVYETQAQNIPNPHVAGAGDTFLSAFTLAYITSHHVGHSADIASAAAEIAIRKESTSSCSAAELKCYYHQKEKYISSPEELDLISQHYRETGKRIVFTNGCFDILHSGHVTYLHCARELGDVLIVGINQDESIKRIKGDGRPINTLNDRVEVLSGLTSVTHVVSFGSENDDTPEPVIHIVKPDVFVKGGDYTKETLPEAQAVEMYGGEIVFIPYIPDHSTTAIIHRITNPHPSTVG